MIRLYGTTTSPFVRRVRVVAMERGLDFALTDTATPAGQAKLREQSPIWKVPVAATNGDEVDKASVLALLDKAHQAVNVRGSLAASLKTRNALELSIKRFSR
jgi:glutathione S-transferase